MSIKTLADRLPEGFIVFIATEVEQMKKGLVKLGMVMFVALLMGAGCSAYNQKLCTLPGGQITREHGKPSTCGYYSNFDPAAVELEVTPVEDTNPVRTQHVFVATVKDKNGCPLPRPQS